MRKIARTALSVALVLGSAATIVGFLAPWWPPAEILNHFRPFAVAGSGGEAGETLSAAYAAV